MINQFISSINSFLNATDLALFSISIITLLFILELVFYALKKPRGLSNIILVVGITGMFCSLFLVLFNLRPPVRISGSALSEQLLAAISVGLIAAVSASVLLLVEKVYGIDRPEIAISRSLREIIAVLKNNPDAHALQESLNSLSQMVNQIAEEDVERKNALIHLSQQIFDLTNQFRHEAEKTRKNQEDTTKQLIYALNTQNRQLIEAVSRQKPHPSSATPPRIIARNSTPPVTENGNESVLRLSKNNY